jgi:glycosyltransferase involved in cell wall biosynthesis
MGSELELSRVTRHEGCLYATSHGDATEDRLRSPPTGPVRALQDGGALKKISVVCPDLSNNCLGRAHLLAALLKPRFRTEVVGPVLGGKLWPPLAEQNEIPYVEIRTPPWPLIYFGLASIPGRINGDIIYVSKPLVTSLTPALLSRLGHSRPLLVDIDDWQLGFAEHKLAAWSDWKRLAYLGASALQYYRPNSYWNAWFTEGLVRYADRVTVSNSFLRSKFGGTVIPHARDTDLLDPARYDGTALRRKYGLPPDRKIVMFLGTPVEYKGIEDLVEALRLLERPEVMLLIVGMDRRDRFCRRINRKAGETLGQAYKPIGFLPYARLPEALAAADVVAVPQRSTKATWGQIPAKLFDAMAMARPVLTTRAGCIPEVVGESAWLAEAGRPESIRDGLVEILDNPDRAKDLGAEGRRHCVERYSMKVVGEQLLEVFADYE